MNLQHTTTSPRMAKEIRAYSPDELARWLSFYRCRLALVEEETREPFPWVPADRLAALVACGRAWYEFIIGLYENETERRHTLAARGLSVESTRYPPQLVSDMKRRADLGRWFEDHFSAELSDERHGKRRGPCPIHGGNDPSAFIVYVSDPTDQHYHCFSCGAGGDVYSAIIQGYGVEFPEAVRILAAFLSVTLPEKDRQPTRPPAPRRTRFRRSVIPT